jgi:ubiquinol oxidase
MTKYRFAFSVALSLQFLMLRAIDHCHAFTSPKLATETPSRYQKQICSTTKPIDEQSILERDLPSNAAAEAAIKELEKLLERQRADIDITEDLLCRLKANCEGDEDVDSYVKSITAGFDYGFVSRSEGATMSETRPGYGPPKNFWSLGWEQFFRNLDAIKGEYKDEEQIELSEKQEELQDALEKLTLNSTAIWEREFADGPIDAPWIIKAPYLILCYFLDVVFEGKYTPSRFFLLETVARMPYFSYISMLHLYETLGFWRRSADMKRIHFAEELNEFRHLLIMESLGGDQRWWVRFLAQHSAIVYYWVLCVLWALSPSLSYKFSELLESHAVNTYGQFLDENEEKLRQMPPPLAATEYYTFGLTDPFYSEIQTSSGKAEVSIATAFKEWIQKRLKILSFLILPI